MKIISWLLFYASAIMFIVGASYDEANDVASGILLCAIFLVLAAIYFRISAKPSS